MEAMDTPPDPTMPTAMFVELFVATLVDMLDYEITLLCDQKNALEKKIVYLALEGRSVRGTASKLKQVRERHHQLSMQWNNIVNDVKQRMLQLQETKA